jgi:hypothetical protein
MKRERTELTYPKAGAQLAFARAATALAAAGSIDRLAIQELEVGRLRVRELVTD